MTFPPDILSFLKDLKKNNNREWFDRNRERYQEARQAFELYVAAVMAEIRKFDPEAVNAAAKDCIFRIFRDIRFTKDKTPYKVNFGAYIARGGRKSPFAGYYLHIEPGASMLAGGIYMPQPEVLKAIRNEIFTNIDEFKAILHGREFRKHFDGIDAPAISRPPRGFPPGFPDMELLQYQYYTVAKYVSDAAIQKADFTDEVTRVFRALRPLNKFLNEAVSEL